MKTLLWILIATLIVAHQDFWYWTDETLVMGFLPIGLAYHMGISLAAGIVWLMMCLFAWPRHLDNVESSESTSAEGRTS